MQGEFLQKFYDQLFENELKTLDDNDPMFRYADTLTRVCKKIKEVCNNSRLAVQTFSSYIFQNFIDVSSQFQKGSENKFMISLKKEQKHIINFTQISLRFFLLSYYCKQGIETKRKQWRNGLEELIQETRMLFMFNCHESLSTMLVNLINRTSQICNELPFYERLALAFAELDLDYFYDELNEKKRKIRENCIQKSAKQNKINFTPKSSANENKNNNEKVKLLRKSIKIVNPNEKITQEQNLLQRISEFKSSQKQRKSEKLARGSRRTIFQSRTFMKKMDSDSQECQEYSSVFFQQQEEVPVIQSNKQETRSQTVTCNNLKAQMISKQKNKTKKHSKTEIQPKQQCTCDQQFLAPGTPPRRVTRKQAKKISSIPIIRFS